MTVVLVCPARHQYLVCVGLTLYLMQVLGNAKGAVAVVISVLVFRNPVSLTGMFGYAVCVAGCFAYSEVRIHICVCCP